MDTVTVPADAAVSEWGTLADAYAFLGNSLLRPMSQTADAGLDAGFWRAFPVFECAEAAEAAEALAQWAAAGQGTRDERVLAVSVEHTALFVGPPSPAAPPWETMNRNEGVTVGFGEPTFQMREILGSLGLQQAGENNQYEDHIGLELLCLSEMCRRVAAGQMEPVAVAEFVRDHPLGWIETLRAKVDAAEPNGYLSHLLALAQALLVRQAAAA